MRSQENRLRVDRMLDADKEALNEASKKEALKAFARVANEFFETDGNVDMALSQAKRGMEVTVSFHIVRVKNFNLVK